MSFKLHLIIVSFIIVAVYLVWQIMNGTPEPASKISEIKPYSIAITHASWGLNCLKVGMDNANAPHDAYASGKADNNKLRHDNVFARVSLLCNGQLDCDVPVDVNTLGDDPAPECNPKTLEIEYRCFSYDRPWIVKGTSGALTLHCQTPAK